MNKEIRQGYGNRHRLPECLAVQQMSNAGKLRKKC